MYGGRKRSHEQARTSVCAACGQKALNSKVTSIGLANIVREEVSSLYDRENTYFPNGLCGSCRTYLFKAKKGEVVPVQVRDRWNSMDFDSYRPPSRSSPCQCKICSLAQFREENLDHKPQPDLPRKPQEDQAIHLHSMICVCIYF